MEKVVVFAGMAIVTYLTRVTMMVALGHSLPPLARRWLGYVPASVLAALIAPAALAPRGTIVLGPRVWATLAGAVVAWRTKNVLATIAVGMAVLWLLQTAGA